MEIALFSVWLDKSSFWIWRIFTILKVPDVFVFVFLLWKPKIIDGSISHLLASPFMSENSVAKNWCQVIEANRVEKLKPYWLTDCISVKKPGISVVWFATSPDVLLSLQWKFLTWEQKNQCIQEESINGTDCNTSAKEISGKWKQLKSNSKPLRCAITFLNFVFSFSFFCFLFVCFHIKEKRNAHILKSFPKSVQNTARKGIECESLGLSK